MPERTRMGGRSECGVRSAERGVSRQKHIIAPRRFDGHAAGLGSFGRDCFFTMQAPPAIEATARKRIATASSKRYFYAWLDGSCLIVPVARTNIIRGDVFLAN